MFDQIVFFKHELSIKNLIKFILEKDINIFFYKGIRVLKTLRGIHCRESLKRTISDSGGLQEFK